MTGSAELAATRTGALMVRLVKGAYWDSEIKRAQVDGQPDYPVFTTKQATDFLSGVRAALLEDRAVDLSAVRDAQRATRWRRSSSARGGVDGYEFQRLHGMGVALYKALPRIASASVRIYAPVGAIRICCLSRATAA